jgi:P-type Cu+ transporter
MEKKVFTVKGMHCASCVYNVEKALKKAGAVEADVNLATNKVNLSYDSDKTRFEDLKSAISNIGYSLEEVSDKTEKEEKEQGKKLKIMLAKAILGIIFTFLIMGSIFPPFNNYFPEILKSHFIHLFYALIIQVWGAWELYPSGIKSMINRMPNMDSLIIIGTGSAFIYSTVLIIFFAPLMKTKELMPYFDVSTAVIGLIMLGKYLETKAKSQSNDAIKKLINLQPKEATVLVTNTDSRG